MISIDLLKDSVDINAKLFSLCEQVIPWSEIFLLVLLYISVYLSENSKLFQLSLLYILSRNLENSG